MFDWVHYQFPSKIFFERDSTHKLGSFVKDIGNRAMLFTVRDDMTNNDELAVIKTSLDKYTSGCIIYDDLETSPGYEELDTAAHFTKKSNSDMIIAYGARSSLNAAKGVALLSTNEIFAADLPNERSQLKKPPLPLITVPTAPSLGEESTPSFSIYNHETRSSYFGTDYRLFPSLIFLDPNISMTMTANEITRNGVAVMAVCIESILSKKANDITTFIALQGLELITKNLSLLINDINNHSARMNVCMASIMSGMAHSNSMLGLCYTIASATSNLTELDFFNGYSNPPASYNGI